MLTLMDWWFGSAWQLHMFTGASFVAGEEIQVVKHWPSRQWWAWFLLEDHSIAESAGTMIGISTSSLRVKGIGELKKIALEAEPILWKLWSSLVNMNAFKALGTLNRHWTIFFIFFKKNCFASCWLFLNGSSLETDCHIGWMTDTSILARRICTLLFTTLNILIKSEGWWGGNVLSLLQLPGGFFFPCKGLLYRNAVQ